MAPPKNAPRDALVSAKDARRGVRLRAAISGPEKWARAENLVMGL